ncbi:MAG: PDZ domain-containing protein [Actinobacteria bacterium]|nr:PDZ domain-containing protein [Actinomycetota bacterium]
MTTPSLGVNLQTGTANVSAVTIGGLADLAGVQRGDRLLSLHGHLVATSADVAAALNGLTVGDLVQIQVARSGQVVSLESAIPAPPAPVASLGVRLKQGTLEVLRTEDGGVGEAAGLMPGDVILAINGQVVASAGDVREAVDKLVEGEVALIQVNRGGVVTSMQAAVLPSMMSVRQVQVQVTAASTPGAAAPGWYPNPTGDGSQAYWTGSRWQNAVAAQGSGVSGGYQYPQTSGLAVAALICAFLVPFILPIILGVAAKNDIRRSNGMKTGEGMATAGIVLGWIFTILILLWVVLVFVAIGSRRY